MSLLPSCYYIASSAKPQITKNKYDGVKNMIVIDKTTKAVEVVINWNSPKMISVKQRHK